MVGLFIFSIVYVMFTREIFFKNSMKKKFNVNFTIVILLIKIYLVNKIINKKNYLIHFMTIILFIL